MLVVVGGLFFGGGCDVSDFGGFLWRENSLFLLCRAHQCRQQRGANPGPESQDDVCVPLSSKKQFPRVSASAQNPSGSWC